MQAEIIEIRHQIHTLLLSESFLRKINLQLHIWNNTPMFTALQQTVKCVVNIFCTVSRIYINMM